MKDMTGVYLHWSIDELGYRWPSFRVLSTGELLEPFTSYLESLVLATRKRRADPESVRSEIEHATYALSALACFLIAQKLRLYRIRDDWLEDLRECMLDDVRANPISRGKDNANRRTVNRKLQQIYNFIYWCQLNKRLPGGTIGWAHCRVRSSLPEADNRGLEVDFKPRRLYPACYPRVGEASRQDESQYCATPEDLRDIEDHFWKVNKFELAVRNTLALRIQEFTAWRIGSVNSLTIDQFSEEALIRKRAKPFCLLQPPRQKFGYEKAFAVDWILIDRIVEFIKDGRRSILEQAGVDESVTKRRLFLSVRGTPLTTKAYGEIFSDAFGAIGAPKGAGGHSIRRYRTVEEVKAAISRQKMASLPVDRDTIVRMVMELLGHNSEDSGRAYDRVADLSAFESRESEMWRRLEAAELERDALRATIARLSTVLPEDVVHQIAKSTVSDAAERRNLAARESAVGL